jgi:O-antigen/teichoic acid export membrane protein
MLRGGEIDKTLDRSTSADPANLTHKGLHALKWRYAGTIVQFVLQFAVGIVLARLLTPEEFGVMGMALIVITFGRWFGDLGFSAAVIQYPAITHNHVRASFTGSVTMGLLLFLALWILAAPISRMFMQDSLAPILRVVGVIFVFSAMSATPGSILRRELRFRTLAGLEIISYAIGYGLVGISLAVLGLGIWSLIAAHIIRLLCMATLGIWSTKQPLKPYFGVREYRELFRVASGDMLNNLTQYMAQNFSYFVIGRYLGASSLGLYRRSSDFVNLHLSQFSTGLSSVMFPLYSTIQGDVARLSRAHRRTISVTAVCTMPVLFAIAAAPEVIIVSLFGQQWKAAAGPLQILCLSGPFMAITHILEALSHALGFMYSEWWRQAVSFGVLCIALWLLLPLGIIGAAMAVALATLARYLILAQLSVSLMGCSWKDFFAAHLPGCLLGCAVSTPVFLMSLVIDSITTAKVLQLLILLGAAVLALGVSLSLFPATWLLDLYPWVIDQFGTRLPSWLSKPMAAKMTAAHSGPPHGSAISKASAG